MVANVRIPVGLRRLTGGLAVVPAKGNTVGEALVSLGRQFPDLKSKVFDADGRLSGLVGVYLNGENVTYREGLATPLPEEAEIMLLPAAAGG